MGNISAEVEKQRRPITQVVEPDPSASEIVAELESGHRRELNKLSDLAFVFLNATEGEATEAEGLLDDFIDLLFEGGALQTWRYRILLAGIREGL